MKLSEYNNKLNYYTWITTRLEYQDKTFVTDDYILNNELHTLTNEQIRDRIAKKLEQRYRNFTYKRYPFLNK